MKSTPKIGSTGRRVFSVEQKHCIDFSGDGMPSILCTPSLIWSLEHTARDAVLDLLDSGESTVGVRIDIEHLAPTPVGVEVTCQAKVIYTDGNVISFQLEARDAFERIAIGTHKLRIIQKERLKKRADQKL